jgi:hypothetical protein
MSIYATEHCFSQILFDFSLHLSMSATPPVGTPGTLIASFQHDMTNASTPAGAADLHGTYVLYYEVHISGSSPAVNAEREGGLGTFGLPGGVSMARHWCFSLQEMDKDFIWLELGDVAKHDKNKLLVPEAMMHIMAPATKQTNSAAYEALALAVASLTVAQYNDLTQEQHPVTEWNRIILAIKAGRFDTGKEYEEIKLRASKKSVFSQAFTPRKKVKFAMEDFARAGGGSRSLIRNSEFAETTPAGI